MKLFNRGSPQTAAVGPASAVAPSAAPVPPVATAPPPKEEPPAPDVAEILESSVKDISEKVARLASSVESSGEERAAFEAKISMMEERMRKLSSLTEMISAQYNPFMGDAPPQREALPAADAGLAAPPLPPAAPSPAAAAPALELEMPPEMAAPAFDPTAPVADDLDFGAPTLELPPPLPQEGAPAASYYAPSPPESVRVETFGDDFQSSMVLLKWADMLLQNTRSREGVVELADYYHNIGWLGDAARDQLLAYAGGIAFDERGADEEWRATAEFHEVSLLFLEKLRTIQKQSAPGVR